MPQDHDLPPKDYDVLNSTFQIEGFRLYGGLSQQPV